MRPLIITVAGGLLLMTAGCASTTDHTTAGASVVANQSTRSAHSSSATSAVPVTATSKPAAATTQRIVLRPVTARGTVATGYRLSKHLDESITCGGGIVSRAAVQPNIDECSPTAAYPVACWADSSPNTALCLRNPFAKQVDLIRTDGAVAPSKPVPTPSPFGLTLSDGSRCTLRIGGAWGELDDHPDLYGTYGCGSEAIWGPANSDGINRTGSQWTVRLAPLNGHGLLHIVKITNAIFVGTAS